MMKVYTSSKQNETIPGLTVEGLLYHKNGEGWYLLAGKIKNPFTPCILLAAGAKQGSLFFSPFGNVNRVDLFAHPVQ